MLARIVAFSRDDVEMQYTAFIECEIDGLDKTPVHISWLAATGSSKDH
jgi:hypothetical protein